MSWIVKETVTSNGRYNRGSKRFGLSSIVLVSDIDFIGSSLFDVFVGTLRIGWFPSVEILELFRLDVLMSANA